MKDRICRKCEESFPLDEDNYHRDSKDSEGFTRECKSCLKMYYDENYSAKKEMSSNRRTVAVPEISFDTACLKEKIKRDFRIISIYKESF